MNWHEEPISDEHDRQNFDCGSEELNDYLRRYARQNHASGGSKTFVAVSPDDSGRILGYYTISPASIEFESVPPELRRRLGRYPVPVYRLARLAVDATLQRQGLGGELLLAAATRALAVADQAGGIGLLIEAKDEAAAVWYKRFGAVELIDSPLRLFLPFSVISRAIAENSL